MTTINYFQCEGHQAHKATTNRYPSFYDNYGDVIYILPFFAEGIGELVKLAGDDADLETFLWSELSMGDGVMLLDGSIYWGADIFDYLK